MGLNTINWAASALVSTIVAALACLVAAVFARDGGVFALALAAGIGIAAVCTYAAAALRQADRRVAKLSGELTVLSERLLRLESSEPVPDTKAATQVEALAQATGALADALDGQDARLRSMEARMASLAQAPAALPDVAPAAPVPRIVVPPRVEAAPPATVSPRLTTRDDFARAASAILGRLGQPAPQPAAAIAPTAPAPTVSDEAVLQDLEAGRLELWIQPIVTLPQRRARLYLALPHLRGSDGGPLGPELLHPILVRNRRLPRLDAFALSQSLTVAAHLAARGSETALCLSLSREALGSPGFVEGTAGRLAEDPTAAGQLVLAMSHDAVATLSPQETAALERFRSFGVGLAATDVPNLDRDWAQLSRRGFDYATLAIETILGPRAHTTTAFLVAEAARAGIALAATGVDEERQVPDLLDFEVPLACGPAIAPARPVRAEALSPRVDPPPSPPPAGGDEPASFRDFLRRIG